MIRIHKLVSKEESCEEKGPLLTIIGSRFRELEMLTEFSIPKNQKPGSLERIFNRATIRYKGELLFTKYKEKTKPNGIKIEKYTVYKYSS